MRENLGKQDGFWMVTWLKRVAPSAERGVEGVIAVEMLMSSVMSDLLRGLKTSDSDEIRTVSWRRRLISHLLMIHFLSAPRLIMSYLCTTILLESF